MRSRPMRAPLVLFAFALPACATVAEPRVRAVLIGAGVSPRDARCMAERMVDRLSIGQLRSLERLGREGRRARSLPEFIAAVEATGDAEAIAVTASSAALCATGLADKRGGFAPDAVL